MDDSGKTGAHLAAFFEGLRAGVTCVQEIRGRYDRKMAFDFNSLNFFWPGENKTSEILAFFLNPAASHGQGAAFLESFCTRHIPPNLIRCNYSEAKVFTEYPTDHSRRIDVVVEFPGAVFIGIENKIWAKDQPDQLGHYSKFLAKKSGGKYHLFYLSPYGTPPSDVSITQAERDALYANEKLTLLSYQKDMLLILDGFIQVCMAENVQAFLKDFQKYLKQQYVGEKEMSEKEYIRTFISKDENLSLAWGVASQINEIKNKLWEKTIDQLVQWAKENSYMIDVKSKSVDDMAVVKELVWVSEGCSSVWTLEVGFDGNRKDLLWAVRGDGKVVGNDILQTAKPQLGYRAENRNAPNIFTEFPSPFNGNWNVDPRPWDAMVEQSNGRNAFVSMIIAEYDRVKNVMSSVLSDEG
jgi:hypothetical protein